MKTRLSPIKLAVLAALLVAPFIAPAQTPPLRSYTISGIENSRYFDATKGWIVSTQAFSGAQP